MTVVITKPSGGAQLKGAVTVTATYSGSGFDIATASLDGLQLASDSSQPISMVIDSTRIGDGPHTLTVAVRYRSGHKVRWQKASIAVTVKNVVTPPPAKPTIPTGLTATPGDRKVTLNWSANPAAQGVDRYQVYEADAFQNLNVTGLTYVATTDHTGAPLVNGRAYSFRVSAHNSVDYGDWTTAVSATPVGQLPSNVARSAPSGSVTT